MTERNAFAQEKFNLHTHSWYCGHGSGEILEYAQEAVSQGLQVLGMSEHCPVPDNRWGRTRMDYSLRDRYLEDCLAVRSAVAPDLLVLRGFECDYLPEYRSYYRDEILGSLGCDYLVGSVHDLSTDLGREQSLFSGTLGKRELFAYTDRYLQALQSGLFLFGAHPDLFAFNYRKWDADAASCSRAIVECASSCSVALEINQNGMRKNRIEGEEGTRYPYPLKQFWAIAAEYPVKVICNSDAHKPDQINDRFSECSAFAAGLGIEFASCVLGHPDGGGYEIRIG